MFLRSICVRRDADVNFIAAGFGDELGGKNTERAARVARHIEGNGDAAAYGRDRQVSRALDRKQFFVEWQPRRLARPPAV
ncbi:hypothetical protein D3C86_1852150 [compost metagenome]